MAKVSEDAAAELPLNMVRVGILNPERVIADDPAKKVNRHVQIAKDHMRKRRDALSVQISKLTDERDGIDAAIAALE